MRLPVRGCRTRGEGVRVEPGMTAGISNQRGGD